MFRPPSLFVSRVVPTAASSLAGQLRRLHPSRTCIVASARIGYAIRPTTGNWRNEDFHLARFTALSTAPLSFGVHSSSPLPPSYAIDRRTPGGPSHYPLCRPRVTRANLQRQQLTYLSVGGAPGSQSEKGKNKGQKLSLLPQLPSRAVKVKD